MQVLVADDDPVCRKLLCDLIAPWGFEVLAASDGVEALAVLSRPDAPPLVILDWSMPRMDGFEVCRAVRGRKGGDRTYILLVTARGNREELLKVVIAGADDYLTKPFEPADLKIRLRAALRIIRMQEKLAGGGDAHQGSSCGGCAGGAKETLCPS